MKELPEQIKQKMSGKKATESEFNAVAGISRKGCSTLRWTDERMRTVTVGWMEEEYLSKPLAVWVR